MWRKYEKDIKALPAAVRLSDKQVPSSLPAIANIAYHDNTMVRDLESRVKLSEQSNRVLLEELMKLQQDLKAAFRQNEEMVRKEQQERLAIKDKVDAAENMYAKVSMQLLRTEEKVNKEHTTLASLLNQSKEVERALAGEQQRSQLKGEQIDRYISRFRDEISELRQMNEQIHSNLRLLSEDVKTLKHRFEMQNSEFDSATQEMRQKLKRVEADSMATMESMLRRQENRSTMEGRTSQLKQSVDLKVSELRDAMNEMRRKTDVEASDHRAANQQAQLNIEKIQLSLREMDTKYQEISHLANFSKRDKESEFEVEKTKLVYKMAELSEEQNKKALQREMQLREEAQMKFTILEKKLQEEHASRLAFEKSVRYELTNILESLKTHLSEELQTMRENAKLTQVHGDESLVKMKEYVSLMESEIEAGKKAFEEVLHAEIVARQTQSEKTMKRCKELQEKLSVAVASLQQAIAGVTTQTQDAVEQVKKDMYQLLDQSSNSGVTGLADFDRRLSNLTKHLGELEETIEEQSNKPVELTDNSDYERLKKRVDLVNKWQEGGDKTLKEVMKRMQPLNSEISKIKNAVGDLQIEMEADRMGRAAAGMDMDDFPSEDTTTVDPSLERKVKKMKDELAQITTQMEKLEHTVNTLRTVLTQKISSEAKTRSSHISELKEQLQQIQKTVDDDSEKECETNDDDATQSDDNSKKQDDSKNDNDASEKNKNNSEKDDSKKEKDSEKDKDEDKGSKQDSEAGGSAE